MTVLAHPALLSKPALADELAKQWGGVWEIHRRPHGGFCRLVPNSSVLHRVIDWCRHATPASTLTENTTSPDPNGPRAA